MGLKENLFALKTSKPKTFVVEGVTFFGRKLSASEAVAYSEFASSEPGTLAVMTRLLALSLSDEKGNRLIADEEEKGLGDLPISVVRQLFESIAEFNSLGEKAIASAEKN